MFGVSHFFLFLEDINNCIHQGCIVLVKSDSEDMYSFSILNKLCFLHFYSKNPKKSAWNWIKKKIYKSWFPQKYNIDKCHVTLKTEVMMLKIQLCITDITFTNKNKKYKIVILSLGEQKIIKNK